MDLFDWIYVEEGPLLLFKMGPVKSLTLGRYMPTPLAVSIRGWGVGVITILKQTPPFKTPEGKVLYVWYVSSGIQKT